jgi:hypothetical protein
MDNLKLENTIWDLLKWAFEQLGYEVTVVEPESYYLGVNLICETTVDHDKKTLGMRFVFDYKDEEVQG